MEDEYPNASNHIAIFETQLRQPPILALSNHTHKEFMMATRLNFTGWKLVDVDNYMKGNPPFTQHGYTDHAERLPDFVRVEEEFGDDWDREALPKESQESLEQAIAEGLRWLDTYEPNSNKKLGEKFFMDNLDSKFGPKMTFA